MSVEDGLKLGLGLMKDFLKSEFNFERIAASYIKVGSKRYHKLTNDDMKGLVK